MRRVEQLLAVSNGLHLVRGRWVEVDRDRLRRLLDEFQAVETAAAQDGLSFGEAMRLLAGAHVPGDIVAAAAPDWSRVVAGPWLAKTLAGLRDPSHLAHVDPGAALKATLRRISRSACDGCTCSPVSAWAPASPTTWASARRCRCWRCCW